MLKKRFKNGDEYVVGAAGKKKTTAPAAPAAEPTNWLTNIAGLGESLSGLSESDKQTLNANVLSSYAPGQLDAIKARDAEQAAANATNKRFGNDMAWLDPEFTQRAYTLGESARAKVSADPNLVDSQQRALDVLFGIADGGGATAQERQRRAGARRDSEGWLRGQREADMQDLAERGMSGSGAEILALGNDRQAAAQRNSAADLETDAWLEQRALDAAMRGGELAGQMRDTGFREGQTRAGATDEFAKLNANTINSAEAANKSFKQNAWQRAIDTRTAVDQKNIDRGINIAGGLLSGDRAENQAGYGYSGGLAQGDANAYNNARENYNAAITTPNTAKTNATAKQDFYESKLTGDSAQAADDFASLVAGFGTGGGGGAAGALSTGGGSTWGSSGANTSGQWGAAPTVADVTGDDDDDD